MKHYACNGDTIFQNLADIDKPVPFDVFGKAMGLLGGAGWELVSVQYGLYGVTETAVVKD